MGNGVFLPFLRMWIDKVKMPFWNMISVERWVISMWGCCFGYYVWAGTGCGPGVVDLVASLRGITNSHGSEFNAVEKLKKRHFSHVAQIIHWLFLPIYFCNLLRYSPENGSIIQSGGWTTCMTGCHYYLPRQELTAAWLGVLGAGGC